MTPMKYRLNFASAAAALAFFALAACQDRKPSQAPLPPASSGEYPTPSEAAPSSTSGAGTGSAVSSDSKADGRK